MLRLADWNIPKHLARFDWDTAADGSLTVKVYPYDTETELGTTESKPSSVPLLQARIKKVPYVPSFPFDTDWVKYIGMSLNCVFPPLPKGKGIEEELAGTDKWIQFTPGIGGPTTDLITIDLAERDKDGKVVKGNCLALPGLKDWHFGVKSTGATMNIGFPTATWE